MLNQMIKGLPSRLLLGGKTFKVRYIPQTEMVDSGNWGEAAYADREIRLSQSIYPEEDFIEFLGHEISHAWLRANGDIVSARDEVIVERFGRGLIRLIALNPELTRYLQKHRRKIKL